MHLDGTGDKPGGSEVGSPGRPRAPTVVTIFNQAARLLKYILDSGARTRRAAFLLTLVCITVILIAAETAKIVALLMTSAPWWVLVASVLGGRAVARGRTKLGRRRHTPP